MGDYYHEIWGLTAVAPPLTGTTVPWMGGLFSFQAHLLQKQNGRSRARKTLSAVVSAPPAQVCPSPSPAAGLQADLLPPGSPGPHAHFGFVRNCPYCWLLHLWVIWRTCLKHHASFSPPNRAPPRLVSPWEPSWIHLEGSTFQSQCGFQHFLQC